MFRKTLATLGVVAALTLIPTTAHALDCTNASRPDYTGTEWVFIPDIQSNVHFDGNWGFVEQWGIWVFLPPGTVPGLPGSGGNFSNNAAEDPLGPDYAYALHVQGFCQSSGTDARQTTKGIQLGHGCP
ncbi:hypothetical protein [Sinomonas mesophila]|uniref:hypothetical protein n=1 Tax=Sinomonas mesophila TaxID=1531955 RepID=UPI0011156BAE|nr:hypothetical protein [Sinomonas mesophila]